MGLMTRLRSAWRSLTLEDFSRHGISAWLAPPVSAGVSVTHDTAATLSAVNCARLNISNTVAMMPIHLYRRRDDGGRERQAMSRLEWLVNVEPNSYMTPFTFWSTLTDHMLMWGNAYAEIQWDRALRPVALWPVSPRDISPVVDNGRLSYLFRGQTPVEPEDLLHIPGLGFDGIRGYSVIEMARESFGLALAMERHAGSFFGNGAWPGLTVSHPGQLGPEAAESLRRQIEGIHGGRPHRVAVFEEGMKVEKVGIPPDDAQFLESRTFQVVEIARWFNVPPYKLKDMGRATWANVELLSIEFLQDTIQPWLVRIEQELNRKLISKPERGSLYYEHLMDALLRADSKTRHETYSIGFQNGIYSVNDILRRENGNPVQGGDRRFRPANLVPLDQETPAAPAPAVAEPAPDDDEPQEPQDSEDMRSLIRAVVVDTVARYIRREAAAAKRAASPGAAVPLRAWVDKRAEKETAVLTDMLAPIVAAALRCRSSRDPDAVALAKGLAEKHLAGTRVDLDARALTADQVEALGQEWELHRPNAVADAVLAAREGRIR